MAHVGTFYPRLIRPDLSISNKGFDNPPFRMRLITTNVSTGALTTAWRNRDLISEAPVLDPVTQFLMYKVQHPTISSGSIRLTWKLRNPHSPEWTGNTMSIEWFCEFWQGGGQQATFTSTGNTGDIVNGADRLMLEFTTWTTSVNRGLVDKQNDIRFCCARWSDVPWYTPRKLH